MVGMIVCGKSRNCGYIRWGIQSFLRIIELFMFLYLSNQFKISTLVESWSPNIFQLTINRYSTVVSVDPTKRSKSTRQWNPLANRHPKISRVFSGNDYDESGNANEDDDPQFIEVESLSASQVTELVELSFFQACFALSKGDVEPLKLFIVAVKTASKKYEGASAVALAQTVDALPPSLRPLEPQERDLREVWIRAIYLMMGHVIDEFDGGDDGNEVAKTYGPILGDIVAIHKTGMGLNVNQFVASRKDILMPKNNVLVLEGGPEDNDLVRLAVVTQTINVLYTTLQVLEEDDLNDADVDGKTDRPPKSPSASSQNKKKRSRKSGKGFGL